MTPANQPTSPVEPEENRGQTVEEALADIDASHPSAVTEPPAEDPDPDPPVYDERGNVRPRGTPGARPMTKAERVKIARALANGERIVTTAEKAPRK